MACPNVAFLTTDDLHGFTTDDHLAVPFLEKLGCAVTHVPWRVADTDWDAFDIVVVRSTWNYQDFPEEFDETLVKIDSSRARLCNPLALMRWNMRKTYLRDLEKQGVPILPTHWGTAPSALEIRGIIESLDTDEIVIKPVVGANAQDAFRVRCDAAPSVFDDVARTYANRAFLAQPFVHDVVSEGEYSLIYMNGALSHAILKTPKSGDFRVQEEHGGIITAVTPTSTLAAVAAAAMTSLDAAPLYARVDLIRTGEASFAIMEFELIEPALYLRMDLGAAARFADAINAVLTCAV